MSNKRPKRVTTCGFWVQNAGWDIYRDEARQQVWGMLRRMSNILEGAKKECIDSIQGHTFQEVQCCSTDLIERWLQWAQCQFILPPGKICLKHTSFQEGLSEHMKGKSEMTTCRIKTLWLPSPNLKATLKTYSGKSIRRFHFWPVLHSTLYPEQITFPCLSTWAEDII